MASEVVEGWIQNELKLSQMVSQFETDFSNGYLFGEILVQYNLHPSIATFTKKTNKESKIKNF